MTGAGRDGEPSRRLSREAEDAAAVLAVLSAQRRAVVDVRAAAMAVAPQSFFADPARLLRAPGLDAGPGQFWESGLPR